MSLMDTDCRELLTAAAGLARTARDRQVLPAHVVVAAAECGWIDGASAAVVVARRELEDDRHERRPDGGEPRLGSALAGALATLRSRTAGSSHHGRMTRADLLTAVGVAAAAFPVAGGSHDPFAHLSAEEREHVRLLSADRPTPQRTRSALLTRLMTVLSRSEGGNAVLLGGLDLGADTLVEDLAVALAAGEGGRRIRHGAVAVIDLAGLVTSGSAADLAERRLARLVEAAHASPRPLVLYLRDADRFLGRPTAGAVLAGIAGATASGLVLSLSAADHRRLIEGGDDARRAFRAIELVAPTARETCTILGRDRARLSKDHRIEVEESAVAEAVRLALRHLPSRALPGSARDLLEEAVARVGMQTPDGSRRPTVDAGGLADALGPMIGMPSATAGGTRSNDLEGRLGRRVVGQREAVRAVSDSLRRAAVGLADAHRPIGSFLFLGPTGVGKTELARALTEDVFEGADALIRLDMGEFQESHAVARLVGAPPGYVGFGQDGVLAAGLRRRPHAVVLLDEIEKSHRDVYNVLLSVLEEGRLTDGRGVQVDVRHAVVIMTSNVGSEHILDRELDASSIRERVLTQAHATFPPEFLNRIDDLVVFNRLEVADLTAILGLEIARLASRLGDLDLGLEVSEPAARWLVTVGFDPVFGARPLRRTVRREIEDRIARGLVDGGFRPGQRVSVVLDPSRTRVVLHAGDPSMPYAG